MHLTDQTLLHLMDAYADAHPDAEPVENFAELFSRDELGQMLQQADGRVIDVQVTYGTAQQDYRPVGATYCYR
jgi:hypothetical protein